MATGGGPAPFRMARHKMCHDPAFVFVAIVGRSAFTGRESLPCFDKEGVRRAARERHCPLVNHQPPQWTIFPIRMRYLRIRDFGGKLVSELIIAGFVTALGVLSTLRIIKARRLRKEREERRNKRDAEMRRRMGLDW